MAKFEIKFLCETGLENAFIKCEVYEEECGKKTIQISLSDPLATEHEAVVYLDKSTATKFAKTLRTEINKITESEVTNG